MLQLKNILLVNGKWYQVYYFCRWIVLKLSINLWVVHDLIVVDGLNDFPQNRLNFGISFHLCFLFEVCIWLDKVRIAIVLKSGIKDIQPIFHSIQNLYLLIDTIADFNINLTLLLFIVNDEVYACYYLTLHFDYFILF